MQRARAGYRSATCSCCNYLLIHRLLLTWLQLEYVGYKAPVIMHCTRGEENDKVATDIAPRQARQSNNETGKLCLYERERNVCSPSPLQTLDETARALCFGYSTNIASKEWFLPWLSLMRLSAMQVSTLKDNRVMSLLQTGSNLGLMLPRFDHISSTDTRLQGIFSDTQSPSNTEKEQFTPTTEECVQDESDCKPQCITSPVPPTVLPTLQSSPASLLQSFPPVPVPPPLPPLVLPSHRLPQTLPITHSYSNKPTFIAKCKTSLFHSIEPLDTFSVRSILRQGVGQKRKEIITDLEVDDNSSCPLKRAKLDETYITESIEEASNVQIVPTADNTVLQYDSCTQEEHFSNQITCTEMSPKNEVGSSYEQLSSSDVTNPSLDISFQSDCFHQVPGSPFDYATEPHFVEDLFPAVADDMPKNKCTQGASFQNLDSDNEDHTVPIELSVSDLYKKRLFLKKAYNFNEPVEPTRLNLAKPRLRLGLSKKQRCRSLHNASL